MGLQPIYCAPGICKVNSAYASSKQFQFYEGRIGQGRYIDGSGIRFVAGFPEKIGGWISASSTPMTGRPNWMCDYRDSSGANHLCIGTSSHLYTFDGSNITDVTPYRANNIGTLTNPFTVNSGNTVVGVADSSNKLTNGDWVFLGSFTIGGVTINGWYCVSSRTGSGYNITLPVAPSSSGSGVGGTITYEYPRLLLGSNPLTTVNNSYTVTVTQNGHGAANGDYAYFSGATTFNNVTISGEYQIAGVTTNTYTITSASKANASGSGGGSAVIVANVLSMVSYGGSTAVSYGSGYYGAGPYGYVQTVQSTLMKGWTGGAYGSCVICAPIGGTIYYLDTTQGGRAHALTNAPSSVNACFVTPERMVVGLGINGNGLQIAWSDQSDPTQWTSTVTNTANSGRTLQGGDFFVGGIPVANGVSVIWTNRTAFLMNYTGGSTVYSTPILADGAGLIGPTACYVLGGVVYWMSDCDLWQYNGTVSRLPTDDIRDYIFSTKLDTEGISFPGLSISNQMLSTAGAVRAKQEVWFHYPDAASSDNNRYVIYHTDQQIFSIGTNVSRSSWIDSHLFSSPYACDLSGFLWQHETGSDAGGGAINSYITSSMIAISNGDSSQDVGEFMPDFQRLSGNFTITIYSSYYPQDNPNIDGPFTLSPDNPAIEDLRTDGRFFGFMFESNVIGGDFRVGLPAVLVTPAGVRR